ncbi:MAG: T9SS type A sorting domain-containing protein [Cryomorphaceae bacterium]|jgi:hypothetical protein|nr:T9SS type A sorting domain-containing protein [Cryomorphaceae bacterium]
MKSLPFLFLFFSFLGLSQEDEHLKGTLNDRELNGVIVASNKANVIDVEVYPNPSEGDLSITAREGATVTIYSASGIYVGTWIVGTEGKVFLEDLTQGTYICSVLGGTEKSIKKFVVL